MPAIGKLPPTARGRAILLAALAAVVGLGTILPPNAAPAGGGETTQPTSAVIPPSQGQLKRLWAELNGSDIPKSYEAFRKLLAAGDAAVRFLESEIKPAQAADPKRIGELVGRLDDEKFTVRDKAHKELAEFDLQAEPHLRKLDLAKLSLEARWRVEALLKACESPCPTHPEVLAGL
ncbi:MAG TPA: hypothetical protein VMZ50_04470, partial [Phycisphaerae bacterium]|nr:hypothetical protein [Phycisphaerae bacterium]